MFVGSQAYSNDSAGCNPTFYVSEHEIWGQKEHDQSQTKDSYIHASLASVQVGNLLCRLETSQEAM